MTRKTYLICAVTFCLLMVAAMLAPLELMRRVFPPADRLVSGPLYDGWLVIGPPSLMIIIYVMAPIKRVLPELRAARHSQAAWNSVVGRLRPKLDIAPVAAASCLAVVYLYGLSAYWYANPDGITERQNLFTQPVTYPWSDVVQRRLSCHRSSGVSNTSFILTFKDGKTFDIADTQQRSFVKHFGTFFHLTDKTALISDVRDLSICPAEIYAFLSNKR